MFFFAEQTILFNDQWVVHYIIIGAWLLITHWDINKIADILDIVFLCSFSCKNLFVFDANFTKVCSQGLNGQ